MSWVNRQKLILEGVSNISTIDADKLIVLVKSRPEIYNVTLKGYHNHELLSKMWIEIGNELNVPGHICKLKWNNLRNSYARYLRELKNMPTGYTQKRRKWHLADTMAFVRPFCGPSRKISISSNKLFDSTASEDATSNDATSDDAVVNQGNENKFFFPEVEIDCEQNGSNGELSQLNPPKGGRKTDPPINLGNENNIFFSEVELDYEQNVSNDEFLHLNPSKGERKTAAEIVASPVTEYLTLAEEKYKSSEEDDGMFLFFKSILPDTKLLSNRRKRQFKTEVMLKLNQLLDEEESSEESYENISSQPTSTSNIGSKHMFEPPVLICKTDLSNTAAESLSPSSEGCGYQTESRTS